MGKTESISFKLNMHHSLVDFRGHRFHCQLHIKTNVKLSARTDKQSKNLKTMYPTVTNERYQSFVTEIVILKKK